MKFSELPKGLKVYKPAFLYREDDHTAFVKALRDGDFSKAIYNADTEIVFNTRWIDEIAGIERNEYCTYVYGINEPTKEIFWIGAVKFNPLNPPPNTSQLS